MKQWQLAGCLLVAVLALSGCDKKQKPDNNFDYLAVQMSKGDLWSIIDKDGKEVVKEEYPTEAVLSRISSEGAFWVWHNGKYQLYNVSSPKKPVIDDEFTRATRFVAGVAVASRPNEQIRIIDTEGRTIAMLGKDIKRCSLFNADGHAIITNTENKMGVIDKQGNILIGPVMEQINSVSEGLVLAKRDADNNEYMILNMKGEQVGKISTEKYDLLSTSYSEGKIVVRDAGDYEGCFIVLDKTGKRLFDIKKARTRYYAPSYLDGFMAFNNEDEEWGVADERGEVAIRPKYGFVMNLGNGRFGVRKNQSWGVVNEKDETIIGFDFDDCDGMIGDNYLMRDGSSYSIVNSDGKEINAFDYYAFRSDLYAEYVDVTGIANTLVSFIGDMEQAQTASQMAKKYEMNVDSYHYSTTMSRTLGIDDKVTGSYTLWFDGNLTEEKTHEEKVDDGWFVTTHTVSDGWHWTNALPRRFNADLSIQDNAINGKGLYQAMCQKLAEDRTKTGEGTYSKSVKVGGKTMKCNTSLTQNGNDVSIEITFNR